MANRYVRLYKGGVVGRSRSADYSPEGYLRLVDGLNKLGYEPTKLNPEDAPQYSTSIYHDRIRPPISDKDLPEVARLIAAAVIDDGENPVFVIDNRTVPPTRPMDYESGTIIYLTEGQQ